MRILHERCCGLDVHKASIAACALVMDQGKTVEQIRRFGTMTEDLRELAQWLSGKYPKTSNQLKTTEDGT